MTERVVIVGGGFAGLHLVRGLERRLRPGEADVTLVDRNNYHLFTPLLYQVATGELPAHAVAYPLRRVTVGARAKFVQTEVERIDVEAKVDSAALEVDGRPLPQLAQVAVLEAPYAAEDLVRALRGLSLAGYRDKPKGDLIALGRREAAAEVRRFLGLPVGTLVFGGFPAWTVWRANYLTQLLGVRNRATLLVEWTLSYFFSRMVSNTP